MYRNTAVNKLCAELDTFLVRSSGPHPGFLRATTLGPPVVHPWPSGSGVLHISEVTLHRAQLVLRRVIVCLFVNSGVICWTRPSIYYLGYTHKENLQHLTFFIASYVLKIHSSDGFFSLNSERKMFGSRDSPDLWDYGSAYRVLLMQAIHSAVMDGMLALLGLI